MAYPKYHGFGMLYIGCDEVRLSLPTASTMWILCDSIGRKKWGSLRRTELERRAELYGSS